MSTVTRPLFTSPNDSNGSCAGDRCARPSRVAYEAYSGHSFAKARGRLRLLSRASSRISGQPCTDVLDARACVVMRSYIINI
jgi:hypothetical protein